MWLEKIYDLVYSEKEEEIDKQDEALIERLNILLTGVGEESVSKDELERIIDLFESIG